MSEIDLKAMRARAVALSALPMPAPWVPHHPKHPKYEQHAVYHRGGFDDGAVAKVWHSAVAEHFAGLDPQTVIALLDRLERAERECDEARTLAAKDIAARLALIDAGGKP